MDKSTVFLKDDPDCPTEEQTAAAYPRYKEEGHLVSIAVLDIIPDSVLDIDDDSPVFAATCICGDSQLLDGDPTPDNPNVGVTSEAARNWARAHRIEHGLPWQEVGWPWVPRQRTAAVMYMYEGHCVFYMPLPEDKEDEVAMFCTGCFDVDEDPNLAHSAYLAPSWDMGRSWAVMHRERHGLPAQHVIPAAGYVLSIGDDVDDGEA